MAVRPRLEEADILLHEPREGRHRAAAVHRHADAVGPHDDLGAHPVARVAPDPFQHEVQHLARGPARLGAQGQPLRARRHEPVA